MKRCRLGSPNNRALRRRPPSLTDVARLAGVSPQTASRVSTGSSLVAADTEARVREAMRRLGYAPNRAARALRHGAYHAIGVVTEHLEHTGESMMTAGIVDAASERDYTVTVVRISQPDGGKLQRTLDHLAELPIDGLIIVRLGHAVGDHVGLPPQLPVVVCDSGLAPYYPSVNADEAKGARELMAYLIGLGHKRIGHLGGPPDAHPSIVRRAAFHQVMTENALPPGPVWSGDWSIDSGYRAADLVADVPDITAVFCANDEMAFGLLRGLEEKGVKVPGDISVAGFDGTPLSRFTSPPLTTVDQHFRSMAEMAVQQIMGQIAGEPTSIDPVLTPVSLIIGRSTAPPPRRV